MRLKGLVLMAGFVAATALALGALGPASPVGAAPPPPPPFGEPEAFVWHDGGPYPWLRESIIDAAAQTIGISEEEVKLALRHGASLKEIGVRHGVRPEALEAGILRYERHFLDRLVDAGVLTRPEAMRIMDFLAEHIDRIISYHPNA